MKKSLLKLANLLLMLTIIGFFACEGPEGPEGPQGPQGPEGPTGSTGPAGPAGEDGNANVTSVTLLEADITWTEGNYLGRTTNTFSFTESGVDQDIIDHGTVIGYCYLNPNWYILPFIWENAAGTSRQYVFHAYSLNTITLYAYMTSGVLDPNLISEYRFLLITDNTVTAAKGKSAEEAILSKLSKAGVDVNNYYDVIDYYGLE